MKPCYLGHSLLYLDSSCELSAKWRTHTPFSSRAFSSLPDLTWWARPPQTVPEDVCLCHIVLGKPTNSTSPFPLKNLPSKYLGFLECLSMQMRHSLGEKAEHKATFIGWQLFVFVIFLSVGVWEGLYNVKSVCSGRLTALCYLSIIFELQRLFQSFRNWS